MSEYLKQYRKNRAAGLCGCGGSPEAGRAQCAKCREVRQRRRERYIALGKCRDCGGVSSEGKLRCKKCQTVKNSRAADYRTQHPEKHIERSREYNERLKTSPEYKAKLVALKDARQALVLSRMCRCNEHSFMPRRPTRPCEHCGLPRYLTDEEFTSKRTADQKRYREAKRAKILAAYGGACSCCGETEDRFLTIDHVNGDGAQERALGLYHPSRFYDFVIKQGFPDRYRVMCMNCNHGRAYNGGICPHEARATP